MMMMMMMMVLVIMMGRRTSLRMEAGSRIQFVESVVSRARLQCLRTLANTIQCNSTQRSQPCIN